VIKAVTGGSSIVAADAENGSEAFFVELFRTRNKAPDLIVP